jgi:hypothetical protein
VPGELNPPKVLPTDIENQTSPGNETTASMKDKAGEEPPIGKVQGDQGAEEQQLAEEEQQQQAKDDQEEERNSN